MLLYIIDSLIKSLHFSDSWGFQGPEPMGAFLVRNRARLSWRPGAGAGHGVSFMDMKSAFPEPGFLNK